MNSRPASVAEYLQQLAPERRVVLEELRTLLARVLKGWAETFEYGLPAFRRGGDLIGWAVQKNHYVIYLCEPKGFLDSFRERLGKLDCGKGCLRFKRLCDLPKGLLEEILQARHDWPKA